MSRHSRMSGRSPRTDRPPPTFRMPAVEDRGCEPVGVGDAAPGRHLDGALSRPRESAWRTAARRAPPPPDDLPSTTTGSTACRLARRWRRRRPRGLAVCLRRRLIAALVPRTVPSHRWRRPSPARRDAAAHAVAIGPPCGRACRYVPRAARRGRVACSAVRHVDHPGRQVDAGDGLVGVDVPLDLLAPEARPVAPPVRSVDVAPVPVADREQELLAEVAQVAKCRTDVCVPAGPAAASSPRRAYIHGSGNTTDCATGKELVELRPRQQPLLHQHLLPRRPGRSPNWLCAPSERIRCTSRSALSTGRRPRPPSCRRPP